MLGVYLTEGLECGRVIVLLPVSRQRLAVDLFPPVDLLIVKFAKGLSGFNGVLEICQPICAQSLGSFEAISPPRRRSPPLAVMSCAVQPSLAVDLFSLEIFLQSNLRRGRR